VILRTKVLADWSVWWGWPSFFVRYKLNLCKPVCFIVSSLLNAQLCLWPNLYQKDERTRPGNLQSSNLFSFPPVIYIYIYIYTLPFMFSVEMLPTVSLRFSPQCLTSSIVFDRAGWFICINAFIFNPLKSKIKLNYIKVFSFCRAVSHLCIVITTNQLMLYGQIIAVCS
jgi:hypothetical protein